MYRRRSYETLLSRLQEPRHFIQVLAGARQVGKTTLALQVLDSIGLPHHYASADAPTLQDRFWIEQQWEIGRTLARDVEALLVLDEVQKVTGWSELIKHLWDEDTRLKVPLKLLILGSSPLLVQRGLTESLAGRFEVLHLPHWSYTEMREAFDLSLHQYLYFGGYPGAATLIHDRERWTRYIIESLIETTISRDVLLMSRVEKPALLRRLFHLGCEYSGQILSYQKMLGQLQEAGNTTTLAHYLELLAGAGMVTGISKYSGSQVRRRASSPKLQVQNTALMTAPGTRSPEAASADREFWGRLVESAVGAHLVNQSTGTSIQVHYWRHRNQEVDFVISQGSRILALEVKSGRRNTALPGQKAFSRQFPNARHLLIGGQGMALETFLATPVRNWFA